MNNFENVFGCGWNSPERCDASRDGNSLICPLWLRQAQPPRTKQPQAKLPPQLLRHKAEYQVQEKAWRWLSLSKPPIY
jgi:hypothetical protein